MSRFADYLGVLDAGFQEVDWRHELVDRTGQVLATNQLGMDGIEWGATSSPIVFNRNRIAPRSGRLDIPVTEPRFIPTAESALHPDSGNRIRTSMGLVRPGDDTRWFTLATSYVESAVATWNGAASLTADIIDSVDPIRTDFNAPLQFDAGEDNGAVARRVLAQVVDESWFVVPDVGCTVPSGSFQTGSSRQEALDELLTACGWELTATADGLIVAQEIPTSGDDGSEERWHYGTVAGIPVDDIRRRWVRRATEAWRVLGGSLQSSDGVNIEELVYDTDPTSEGYARPGAPGRVVGETRNRLIRSSSQAINAGYAQLRRAGSGPMIVEFDTIANPALKPNDLIDLDAPELKASGTYRALDFTIDPENRGHMTITARGTYDPAINYTQPQPTRSGCEPMIVDEFDRANQNLEDLPGSPGSTDWTEHGRSWFVLGGAAVQRFSDEFSLAFRATPLCASDHAVTVQIGEVPAGRRVGPVARCSSGFDGYAALVDSSGRVSLEAWQNGSSVSVIDSWDGRGSLGGSEITIRAVGTSVQVIVSGSVVASGRDDSRVGSHVGMLGLGGRAGSTAPTVLRFLALPAVG